MMDRNLARGLFLVAISLVFGLGALRYDIGSFSRAGPGLFPLMVASLLCVIGVVTIIQSRFVEKEAIGFQLKNIGLLLGALVCFVVVSKFINMTVGIAVMVAVGSIAASNYSIARVVKVALGLIAVAFAFQKLLGLNLPLY